MENIDFGKLIEDIKNNPEILLDKEKVSDETLLEIQKKLNPYINLTENENKDKKQIAVCSYTNLREDYIKRFTMTSLISFLFQVYDEHEVPKAERVWYPETKNINEYIDIDYIKKQLITIKEVIDNLEETEKQFNKSKDHLNKNDLLDNEEEVNIIKKDLSKLEMNKIGMRYTITQMLKEMGIVANDRLYYITQEAMKYPDIKNIINTKLHTTSEYPENEIPEKVAKNFIKSFLENWFSFDPSIHVRNGTKMDDIKKEIIEVNKQNVVVDINDPEHLTLETLRHEIKPLIDDKENVELLTYNKQTYNASLHILRNEDLHKPIIDMLNNVELYKYYLLPLKFIEHEHTPPQDTFHRWNYYTEVNYEELRTITETLYPERPDLDWAIAIWKIIKGDTDEEIDRNFSEYCQRHQDELPSSLKALELGKWCLLADFKENRKKIQFFNRNTEVLKRIIDRHTEDKKIGAELMKNRVKKVKAKNIMEHGPDAEGLSKYKSLMRGTGKGLDGTNVVTLSQEEIKRLERAKGDLKSARELEVLEEYEKIIKQYDDILLYRNLTDEENNKYKKAKEIVKEAKIMIEVPDNAIQVDVFTTDTKTGEFKKTHFYTASEEAISSNQL